MTIGRGLLPAGMVALLLASLGCAAPAPEALPSPTRTPTAEQTDRRPPSTDQPGDRTVTPIVITVAGQTRTAELADNPTARDLAEQLPLTLTFRDFNRVEKIAKLPRPLTTRGAPAGADPEINDIGYYAPSGDLVFYYGEVGYFNGIVRIGRFADDIDVIQRQPDGFQVTIERA